MREPAVVGCSRVTKMSLWAIGMPTSGPASPAARPLIGGACLRQRGRGVDRQRRAEVLVACEAGEQVLGDLDARQLARGEGTAEARDPELVGRAAHSITFGTR